MPIKEKIKQILESKEKKPKEYAAFLAASIISDLRQVMEERQKKIDVKSHAIIIIFADDKDTAEELRQKTAHNYGVSSEKALTMSVTVKFKSTSYDRKEIIDIIRDSLETAGVKFDTDGSRRDSKKFFSITAMKTDQKDFDKKFRTALEDTIAKAQADFMSRAAGEVINHLRIIPDSDMLERISDRAFFYAKNNKQTVTREDGLKGDKKRYTDIALKRSDVAGSITSSRV